MYLCFFNLLDRFGDYACHQITYGHEGNVLWTMAPGSIQGEFCWEGKSPQRNDVDQRSVEKESTGLKKLSQACMRKWKWFYSARSSQYTHWYFFRSVRSINAATRNASTLNQVSQQALNAVCRCTKSLGRLQSVKWTQHLQPRELHAVLQTMQV